MNRFKWLTIGALVFFISGCTLYSPSSSSGSSDMSSASEDGDASSYGMGMGDNDSMEMLSDDSLSGSLDTIIYFDFDINVSGCRKTNIIFSLLFCFIGSKCDSLKHIENNYALLILKNFTSIIAASGSEIAMIATVMNSAPSSS